MLISEPDPKYLVVSCLETTADSHGTSLSCQSFYLKCLSCSVGASGIEHNLMLSMPVGSILRGFIT